ncbi:MAG: peptidase S8, partial [Oligoflexia bacterium]|nr:peptidase S8 [Oligoflexia bacterium]
MNVRIVAPMLATLLVACGTNTGDSATPVLTDTEAYLQREVMVSVADDADGVAAMHVQEDFKLRELNRIDAIGVARVAIDDDRGVKQVAASLGDDARVNFAEPNYLAHISSTTSPNDPYLGYQWNLTQIDAAGAWQYGQGSGVVVAVLDTGVKKGGPDGITNVLAGYDFYNNDSDPTDGNGHGTFVSGTIGQNTDNGTGVAGIAPKASILPVKVLSDSGYGDINAISNGLIWAADQGADVANMSLGGSSQSQTLEQACTYAYNKGMVLVAASGNEYSSRVGYPAGYSTVIAVGASRYDQTRAPYSNTGSGLGLLAPGGDTSVDQNGDNYGDGILQETFDKGAWTYTFWEGTSMATPHVAAVAALIVAQGVTDPDQVKSILFDTARDVGSSGYDTSTGYGILDAGAAVAMAAGNGGSSGGSTGGST